MATELKFSVKLSGDSKTLYIIDNTLTYSNPDNLTGWTTTGCSATNPYVTDVLVSTISLTVPYSDTVYTLDAIATIPSNTSATFSFPNTSAGLTADDVFPDGYYIVEYNVSGSGDCTGDDIPFTYTSESKVYIDAQIKCSFDSAFSDLTIDCQDCTEKKLNFLIEANIWLQALSYAAQCGQPNKAAEIYDKIENLITFNKCKTC